MITALLIKIFVTFAKAISYLLPTVTSLPSSVDIAFSWLAGQVSKWNDIFAVDTLLTVLTLILSIEASILVFNIINFIINKVRGSG